MMFMFNPLCLVYIIWVEKDVGWSMPAYTHTVQGLLLPFSMRVETCQVSRVYGFALLQVFTTLFTWPIPNKTVYCSVLSFIPTRGPSTSTIIRIEIVHYFTIFFQRKRSPYPTPIVKQIGSKVR
jgi:hypothetical protein